MSIETTKGVQLRREEISEHKFNSASVAQQGAIVVDFEDADPDNPLNWPAWRRWTIALAVASFNLLSILATCTIIPAAPQALSDLHATNFLYQTLLVSIWELGEGINPFFVAPFSRRFGRLPIFHIGNFFAVVWAVAGALSINISMLIAVRFLSGCANTALTLSSPIVGDLFVEERGKALAVATGMSILGEFIAPICGSFIAQAMGWRWTVWINAILLGAMGLVCLVVVRETFAVQILKKKAKSLRQSTGNERFKSKYEDHVNATTFIESILSPLRILVLSPVVLIITLYTAFAYGTQYILSTTITEILENQYSFSRGIVGLGFLGRAIGNVLGMIFYGLTSDRYVQSRKAQEGTAYKIEHRLIHLMLGAIILPLGYILYGWTLAFHCPWIIPLTATGINGFAGLLISVSSQNYLVDAYSIESTSAIASGVIVRALFGAGYPLIGPPLYVKLGLGWGNTVLALILLAFLPFLVILVRKGDKLRTNDRYAS